MKRNHVLRKNDREVHDPMLLSSEISKTYNVKLLSLEFAGEEISRSIYWNPESKL